MRALLSVTAVVAALCFSAGCGNKDVTPVGAVVLTWDASKSSRPSYPGAVIGTRTHHDVKIGVTPPAKGGEAVLTFAFDTAPVELKEDSGVVHHTGVVDLKATVTENRDWTLTSKCDGPDYQMGPVVDGKLTAPEPMVLRCDITLKYGPDFTYGASFWILGDGSFRNESMPDEKVTIDGKKMER